MAFTVNSVFNFNTKKLILDDEEDYSGVTYPAGASAIGVNYFVISPSGTIIHNNTSTTDLDCYPLDDTEFGDTNLQTDVNGNILQGTYQINKNVFYVDGDGDVVSFWKSENRQVNLNFTAPTAVVTPAIDYYSPLLSATDDTNYTVNGVSYSAISRTLKIIPPGEIAATLTTSGGYLSTATFYGQDGGFQYAFTLESILTYEFSPSVSGSERYGVIITIEDDEYRDIEVPDYLCKVYCVLKALEQRYQDAKCSNQTYVSQAMNKFVVASALAQMMRQAYICGKTSDVTQFKNTILSLGNANEDCCCGEDGQPQLVQGLGGGAGTTIVEGVEGETVVTFDGSDTYTVGLSSDIIDILNSLAFDVTSDDGTITVTPSTEDGVTTYDLSVAAGSSTSRLDVEVNCTFPSVITPVFSIANQHLTGSVFQEVTQSAPDTFISLNTATNLTEYLNGELIVKLENFIAGSPLDYFVSCQIVKMVKNDAEQTNIPVEPVVINHDTSTVEIRFRHSDGTMITGAWAGENFNAPMQLKITFTS